MANQIDAPLIGHPDCKMRACTSILQSGCFTTWMQSISFSNQTSLPLDRRGGFAGDVVHNAVDAGDLVHDPA